jgi:hypothetical protein
MFKRQTTSSRSAGSTRRERQGLGPFTSTQLTIIIVTLIVVLGFPFAAFAVTGSNSFITDATTGTNAKVGTQQDLNASVHDPTSGAGANVDANGNLQTKVNGTVGVSGTVTATQASPGFLKAFTFAVDAESGVLCGAVTPPAGFALVVTRITISTLGFSPPDFVDAPFTARAASDVCRTGPTLAQPRFSSPSVTTLDLGAGIGLQNGHSIDVALNSANTAASAAVTVYGYLASAQSCTPFGQSGCY